MHRRLVVTSIFLSVLAGTAASGRCASAPDDAAAAKQEAEELRKQYGRLNRERYYRNAAALYSQVQQFAQIAPDKLEPADLFFRAFYQGDWDEVRQTLERLPDDFANEVYNRMLGDLAGRSVPLLTLDDFLGLADACPGELDTDRIRKLGLLLRVAVPVEQEIWLKQALDTGTRQLGRDGSKPLATGRILMHAGFDDLARTYLPSAAEAAQIEDEAVRDEILKFLASQEELDRFQQSRIASLWVEQAKVLTDSNSDNARRQQAADQLADLLGKAQAASFEPWIRELVQRDLAGALSLAVALGKRATGKTGDANVAMRTNYLAAQKTLLQCAGEKTELSQAPWESLAVAMADGWIAEAEHTFNVHPGYRAAAGNKPHVVPGELLATAPDGRWADALPAPMREKVDVCLSKAVLVSDRYQDAAKLIVALAGRNPQAGVSLAEEYLKAWAYRHDPQVPEAIRRKYNLAADARIAVTPIMMEKNIAGLAEMMDLFRANGIPPRNAELLVGAFDVCYSKAEVYRRTHIERVLGPRDLRDGVKVRLDDGWFILRGSNTEPIVRVIAESSTEERARALAERVLDEVAGWA